MTRDWNERKTFFWGRFRVHTVRVRDALRRDDVLYFVGRNRVVHIRHISGSYNNTCTHAIFKSWLKISV